MSLASCLLLYGVAVMWLAPPTLARLTRNGIAPRLGVTAWLTAIGSVVAAWLGAVVFLAVDFAHGGAGRSVLTSCLSVLGTVATGRSGIAVAVGSIMLAVAALLGSIVVLRRLASTALRIRNRGNGHARTARMIGRRTDAPDVVIIQTPQRVAYCIAGRPRAIVVTSGALDALDPDQLDAVLAHERAHLSGRHPQLLAVLHALAATLPRIALFRTGATEVARLLEMCADDHAARRHGAHTLLGGLIALCDGGTVPADALGATGVAVLARAGRLTHPPTPLARAQARLLLSAAIALIAAAPVYTALYAATGVLVCNIATF